MKELPLACSLAAGDLRERAERWRALAANALVDRAARDGEAHFTFASSAGTEAELRELVRLEGECCAFLDMTVTAADDGLQLAISGPADAWPVIEDFLRLPVAEPSA